MSRISRINSILKSNLEMDYCDIQDESDSHRGHYDRPQDEETHLRIVIVSKTFDGMTRIQRHRYIQDLLKEEFSQGLHALSLDLSADRNVMN